MKREFTGVFIPAHIWTAKLLPAEKMLLGEIFALSQRSGWCEASRDHFAEWLHCDVTNVTHFVKKLEKAGFLEVSRTPGFRSKMRVVQSAFFAQGVVNQIHGGSEPDSRVVVNPIHGGSEPDSPEIKEKRKSKKEDESASPPTDETLSLNDKSAAGNPPPNSAPPPPAAPAWQPFTPSGELQKMRTDFRCVERFQKETGLPESQYETAIAAFALVAETIQHSGPNDLRQHFFNWSRKPEVVERLRPKPQQHINRSPYAAPAGPVKFG